VASEAEDTSGDNSDCMGCDEAADGAAREKVDGAVAVVRPRSAVVPEDECEDTAAAEDDDAGAENEDKSSRDEGFAVAEACRNSGEAGAACFSDDERDEWGCACACVCTCACGGGEVPAANTGEELTADDDDFTCGDALPNVANETMAGAGPCR
jgi:hypothetical protein